jgi:hypothetical protein
MNRTRNAPEVDRLYGLEPVLVTGNDPRLSPLTEFFALQCPYCGGRYDSRIDLTAGTQAHVEDCQLCCKPIDVVIEIDAGRLVNVRARRADDA